MLGSNFKWMFVGPADTVFFPEAAAHVLAGLDPDLPYVLSGDLLAITNRLLVIAAVSSVVRRDRRDRSPSGLPGDHDLESSCQFMCLD